LVLWSTVLLFISFTFLVVGKYQLLDNLMKYIIVILTISTIIAVSMALFSNKEVFDVTQIIPLGTVELTFLIAFLGWMPAPLDISIWHSIWSVEKDKTNVVKTKLKDALFDFNIGYISALFLGICFLLLGALVMYKSGENFSDKGGVFATQLIALYTRNLGDFSYIFIAIAAFTTMFSTTITTLDASPRAMHRTTKLVFNKELKYGYWFWILFLFLGTVLILKFFMDNMGLLVKTATILSFLTAPFYAILNYTLITGKHTPKKYQPGISLKVLSSIGIVFLIGFSVWFLLSL
jgi:Mn2+/Fe2+ NRAMP family transporter